MKVFFTNKIPVLAESLLKKNGIIVSVNRKYEILPKTELIKRAEKADAIVTLLSDKIDREVIDSLQNCKIIANYAVGYNNIDIAYAKSRGITVSNTPDVLTDATSDTAISLLFACARRVAEGDRLVRSGKFMGWKPEMLLGQSLKGKIFGIAGAGRIGRDTAQKANALGMKIIYYSKTKKMEFEVQTGAKKVQLTQLMKQSDFVSIHLPLNNETKGLINKELLSLLKPSAIFINTARGEIIDEKELIRLLKTKRIFSAGFDVYDNEPKINHDLLNLENVVLLPHIGSGTNEARNAMANLVATNIINVLKGKKPVTPV